LGAGYSITLEARIANTLKRAWTVMTSGLDRTDIRGIRGALIDVIARKTISAEATIALTGK
jgi:hypothetical protein